MRKILGTLALCLATSLPAKATTFNVVGTEVPPLMYSVDDKAKGFYVDLLEAMVSNLDDTEVKISFYPAKRMFQEIAKTEKTFSLGITRNEKREELYKWVGPIYPRIFALFKNKDRSDIQVDSLADIRSYRIGVGRGYAAVNDLLKAGVPQKNIHEATDDTLNIKKLFRNRVDFVVMNDIMLAALLKKEGKNWGDVEKALILNDQYEFWYAFNKNTDDQTIAKFQRALDQLKTDGRYDQIVKKYF
ncbi:substrate-binding periplasmic protein [Neptuniibacter caesariensis]|uniref:Solute-binding protein family 3/N-terminal domain-containing protein n=1 Tax=Neptuniibacter caesariensis TaxID=207954 RepID=A0A7U8C889_NEPCE|nr:transporter substrate-binding domain-containing protein [Neptuniibacter caesariensis]EAR61626.1 hypothetical protein MED92_13266 [Oceanospirillum sp. MED92] [Neptuniibacter caesariensis]